MQTKPPYMCILFVFHFRALARKYDVKYSTFRKWAIGEVQGYEHASGGRGKPRVLSKKAKGKQSKASHKH